MNLVNNIIPDRVISSIGWTLVHSLWQSALIAAILYVVINIYRRRGSNLKSVLSFSALLVVLFISIVTYCVEYSIWEGNSNISAGLTGYGVKISIAGQGDKITYGFNNVVAGAYSNFQNFIIKYVNVIVAVWFAGICLLILKYIGGFLYLSRIRKSMSIIKDSPWNDRIDKICKKLNFTKNITFAESDYITIPAAMGILKPVILFPFGLLTGLPAGQIEAILVHEIAHLKRYDYAMNIVQSVVDALFFYNPFIWWISNKARIEREYCCDDIAINHCGDELTYAKALVNLNNLNENRSVQLAVPLYKNNNQLLRRITRMLHRKEKLENLKVKFNMALLITGLLLTITAFKSVAGVTTINKVSVVNSDKNIIGSYYRLMKENFAYIDSLKLRQGLIEFDFIRVVDSHNRKYSGKINNGKIISLLIDDEKVKEKDFAKYSDLVINVVKKQEAASAKRKTPFNPQEKMDGLMNNREEYNAKSNAFKDEIKQLLLDKGIIKKGDNSANLEIESDKMVLDGKKLPNAILEKTKQIYKKWYDRDFGIANYSFINLKY